MKKENKNRCLGWYLGTMDGKGTMREWDGTKRRVIRSWKGFTWLGIKSTTGVCVHDTIDLLILDALFLH